MHVQTFFHHIHTLTRFPDTFSLQLMPCSPWEWPVLHSRSPVLQKTKKKRYEEKRDIFVNFLFIYSHMHTLFGSFLPHTPTLFLSLALPIASSQNLFCSYLLIFLKRSIIRKSLIAQKNLANLT
jgi:hypothetical protein